MLERLVANLREENKKLKLENEQLKLEVKEFDERARAIYDEYQELCASIRNGDFIKSKRIKLCE
jgi:cell division septum initiation protein DivIVA